MDVSRRFLISVGGEAFREVFKGERLPTTWARWKPRSRTATWLFIP